MSENINFITIKGAKENNLQNINVKIPKNKLVVFTGVSGSGKSSLAFNTIYEEGRRRYVDSLSAYARQFLGGTQKPLVDSIDGLSPAISIEQKTTHSNPRSTVGTVTEVYDYLRLLFARVGKSFCPKHNIEITGQKQADILKSVLKNKEGSKLVVLAPVVKNEKGTHANLFEKLRSDGFLRVRVNGQIFQLDDKIELKKNEKHSIEIVVDRIVLKEEDRTRLSEAIELALDYGNGLVTIENLTAGQTNTYSKHHSCPHGDFDMPIVEPRLFSFNAPSGMCEACKGLGVKLKADPKKIMPDMKKSIMKGGIVYFKNLLHSQNLEWQQFKSLAKHYDIDLDLPLENLSEHEIDILLYGSTEEIQYSLNSTSGNRYERNDFIEGIASKIERKHLTSSSEPVRQWYRNNFMSDTKCDVCNGARLNKYALAVRINGKSIYQFSKLSISDGVSEVLNFQFNSEEAQIADLIVNEISNRLTFLNNVGLDYLTLDRKAETLSGGESQRIRLATQIGSNLTGVLYVLDEPSIGLHQKDNEKLINTLKHMVDIGNTLIVVEHDEDTIRSSDWILDIGPRAGDKGGQVVAAGTLAEIENSKNSITGDFLAKREFIELPQKRRSGSGKVVQVKGASENNLQKVDIKIPLGKLIAVTGVSGSGKSSLVNEVFAKGITQKISNPFVVPGAHRVILGTEHINKIVKISQSPIGRTPRSNPATYTSVFDDIRDVFANTNVARENGYKKGRFSFNVDGGRCDKCRGDGVIKIEMHFLPDVYVVCDHCNGKRYNLETLEAKYKNKSIADVLDMRVEEATEFFKTNQKIKHKLQTIMDVGLGYIRLGQSATTLSGGEAQRIKLATFLQKKPTGRTIYVLDEPTTGLHQFDVRNLITVLNRIVDNGDTVLVIEHNLDMIKVADYIIDLGPGGGVNGGKVIATGSPEQVMKIENSYTGEYLKKYLTQS